MCESERGFPSLVSPSEPIGINRRPLIFRLYFPDALQIKTVCTPDAASDCSAGGFSEAQTSFTDPPGAGFPQPDHAGPVAFFNDPHMRHWLPVFLFSDVSGLTWLTTALNVRDVSAAVDFYTGAMGMVALAEIEGGEGELLFARMRYRGTNFTLNKEGWDSGLVSPQTSGAVTPFIFYMYVDDVQTLAGDMTRAGAKMLSEPSEMFWGDLKARLEDPFGFIWDIAQKL